jgi:hypothetical protein
MILLNALPNKHGNVITNLNGQQHNAQQHSSSPGKLSEFGVLVYVIHNGDLQNSNSVGKHPKSVLSQFNPQHRISSESLR